MPRVLQQVNGLIQKSHPPQQSLNDSLEGEIQAFLIDEDQLHTYDDLTKVNPVTPATGIKDCSNVTGGSDDEAAAYQLVDVVK